MLTQSQRRYQVETTETLDVCGVVKTTRRLFCDGGFISLGQPIGKADWGRKFFPDCDAARKACCEQALALKVERRSQMEKELAELQAKLERE